MLNKRFFHRWYQSNVVRYFIWGMLFSLHPELAFGAETIDQFATNIRHTFTLVKELTIVVAGVCGMVFMILGLVKFKAYKDNPAQIPLSTPVVLIAVSTGLLFLPTMFDLAGSGIFGDAAKSGLPTF